MKKEERLFATDKITMLVIPLHHDPIAVHGHALQLHPELVVVADQLVVGHLQVAPYQHPLRPDVKIVSF